MGGRGMGGGYSTMGMASGGSATLTGAGMANTPSGYTLSDYQNMTDQEMHDFLIGVNDIDMPDFLNNIHMQKLEYALGMTDKPEVISKAELQRRADNDPNLIPIYRSCKDTSVNGVDWSALDCLEDFVDGDLPYIGDGVMGDGLYFSDSFRGSRSYDPRTIAGYLNSNARVITLSQLQRDYDNWKSSHPASWRAMGFARNHGSSWGNSYSQFALQQGYNVIVQSSYRGRDVNCYYNVLDRSAVTCSATRVDGPI